MSLRFAVLQWGARLHYGTPAALESAGLLQALYTDATDALLDGWLGAITPSPPPGRLSRLQARSVPDAIPDEKIHSFPRYNLQEELWNLVRDDHLASFNHRHSIGSHGLAERLIDDDFAGANALYVHACNGTQAIKEAKRRGMFVVLEAVSMPFHKYTEREEHERWGQTLDDPDAEIEANIDFFRDEALMADLVIAASSFVEEGLHRLGVPEAQTAVVPYGLEADFYDREPNPTPGRVLFVGHVNYLKGIPYLAEAARLLQDRGIDCTVRVVGGYDEDQLQRPEFAGPNYIGPVPRGQVKKEFLSADVFAFPTLADGFGIVLLEAAAAGLPIVSTPNCGDVVADGETGYVVPTRDPEALADRIARIVTDRSRRAQMSQAARQRFHQEFTVQRYQEKLVAAIRRRHRAGST